MTDYSRGRGDLQAEPIGYGDGIIAGMTTINNIADLVRILKEQPEWADMIRGILLSEELLELPARFAEFVQLTQESHRIINERLTQIDTRVDRLGTGQTENNRRLENLEVAQAETNRRLESLEAGQAENNRQLAQLNTRMNSLEGRFSNLEGSDYERKVRYRVLHRAQARFGLDNAYLALTQNDPAAPQFNSMIAHAILNGFISPEQSEDLHDADIIISDEGNRHVVVEVSLTADQDDIVRAKRRAGILSAATGGAVTPAVITANLNDAQRDQAAAEEVATFIMAYP